MIKLLHISDLHIDANMTENQQVLRRLSTIRQQYQRHCVVVTGDVTDDGNAKQYRNALLVLPPGAYACPGNHDYGLFGNFYEPVRASRFNVYLPQTRRYSRWSKPVADVIRDPATVVTLIGLDSNIRTRSPLDFACGKIGLWQRFWLKRLLNQHSDSVRIVYFHHHPFDRGLCTKMKDANKLMEILDHNCELVLFGHKHKPLLYPYANPTFIAAGKLDECESVMEITIDGKDIKISDVSVV